MSQPQVEEVTIGSRLKHLVAQSGMSQSEVARKTGIDRSDVNRIVNGHRAPRPHELGFLAKVLNTTAEAIIGDLPLPESYDRSLDRLQESAMRIIQAEGARDEAVRTATALQEVLQEASLNFDREREKWAMERRAIEVEHDRQLRRMREANEEIERQLGTAHSELVEHRMQSAIQQAELDALRAEIATLRQRLASQTSNQVLTAAIAGLAGVTGIAIGRALPTGNGNPE